MEILDELANIERKVEQVLACVHTASVALQQFDALQALHQIVAGDRAPFQPCLHLSLPHLREHLADSRTLDCLQAPPSLASCEVTTPHAQPCLWLVPRVHGAGDWCLEHAHNSADQKAQVDTNSKRTCAMYL